LAQVKGRFMSSPSDHNTSLQSPIRHYVLLLWKPFYLGMLALLFTNFFDVLTPMAMKKAVDGLTENNRDLLHEGIFLYLAFMIGAVTFRYQWRMWFGRFHHRVAEDLRNRLYRKLTELGPSFFEKNPTGELMSLMINDVNQFRMAVGPALLTLLDAAFLLVMILPLMLSMSPDWTWKTLVLFPIVPFVIRVMEDLLAKAGRNQQDRLAEMSGYAQELVSGIRVIKGYAQESHRLAGFAKYSKTYAYACNRVALLDAMFEPALGVSVAVGSAILLFWGAQDVVSGLVTLGTFVAFHEYIRRMVWPMAAIGVGLSLIQQGRASFSRIAQVLATEPEVADQGQLELPALRQLSVRDLSFTYPGADRPALQGVSFELRAGETLGLVGPVGSGKSTLIQLIGRVRRAPVGSLFINDQPIEAFTLKSLRRTMAFVPQEAFLLSRSIRQNLNFGARHPEDDVHQVTRAVDLHEEIQRLPSGAESLLGERGVNLSGGQRQRLTLARAMQRSHKVDAELLILDDSLSAVDVRTERQILETLRSGEGLLRTAIIVSHRLEALRLTDRILVLNEGRIEAIGTHDELLRLSPTYQRMVEIQSESAEPSQEASAASLDSTATTPSAENSTPGHSASQELAPSEKAP